MKNKLKGNVSLTTVLVTTTILLLGGISVLNSSVDLAHSIKASNNRILNEIRARSCLEEALYRVKLDPLFLGTATITFSEGSCSGIVSIDPVDPDIRIIVIDTTYNEYAYTVTKHVNITQDPFLVID